MFGVLPILILFPILKRGGTARRLGAPETRIADSMNHVLTPRNKDLEFSTWTGSHHPINIIY
jgi:hypothetical protein